MLLEIENLTVRYGRQAALDGVTVSVDSKALGLLGPNGAGKSTLIRAMLGLAKPTAGRARLEGIDTRRHPRRVRELVGYMPEHEAYITGMTPVRFLRYMGEVCGLPPKLAMERAHEVLFYVGIGEVRYRNLESLSYGMRQKVRLAQALIHGPRLLILDEPTNGLDPAAREEMLLLINDMVRNSDSRVIISSHLLNDIETCCEEVLVLDRGRAVASGNIEAMKHTDHNIFEIRIKGDLDEFIGALGESGCECRLSDRGDLQVTAPDAMRPRDFFALAGRLNTQVRHFRARRDSLEDIFLKILQEAQQGGNGGHPSTATPEAAVAERRNEDA